MTEKENASQGISGRGILLTIGNESPVVDNTTVMLYMVSMAALKEHTPTAYFSPGMLSVGVVNRLISIATGIDNEKIANGTLSEDEWKKFDEQLPLLMGSPLYIDDTQEIKLSELDQKVRDLVTNKGVRLVVVNPVSLMNDNELKIENVQLRIDYITGKLKELAEQLGITIFAVER